MSSVATIDRARETAVWLEKRQRARGLNKDDARAVVARRTGAAAGTIENLVRGRLKRLDSWLRDRLQALLITELEAEIGRLNHELEIARRGTDHLAAEHVREIEAHLGAARSLIRGAPTSTTRDAGAPTAGAHPFPGHGEAL